MISALDADKNVVYMISGERVLKPPNRPTRFRESFRPGPAPLDFDPRLEALACLVIDRDAARDTYHFFSAMFQLNGQFASVDFAAYAFIFDFAYRLPVQADDCSTFPAVFE